MVNGYHTFQVQMLTVHNTNLCFAVFDNILFWIRLYDVDDYMLSAIIWLILHEK